MATSSPVAPRQRSERLEARVTREQKVLIERAAVVQGRSVTDFVTTTLQDAARRVIEESAIWKLSEAQQHVFVDALLNPPAPNERLLAASKRFEDYEASLLDSRR